MKKDTRTTNYEVEKAPVFKSLLSSLVNFASYILACLFCFYAICYPISINNRSFKNASESISGKKEELNLNLSLTLDSYKEYEQAIQNFYFVAYPNELVSYLTSSRNDKTIGELYNIFVLNLPSSPTINSYSTDYASYYLNEDGSINSSKPGFIKEGLSPRGNNDVLDLFKSSYRGLPSMLNFVDSNIKEANSFISKTLSIGRISSFSFSFLVLEIVVPLALKNKKGIGEAIFKLSIGDKKGYRQNIGYFLLKRIYYIPFIAITSIFFNGYSAVIAFLLPYFINLMYMIFSNDKVSLVDKLSKGIVYNDDGSILFKDEEELLEYRKRALSNYKDKDFISKLSSLDSIEEKLD